MLGESAGELGGEVLGFDGAGTAVADGDELGFRCGEEQSCEEEGDKAQLGRSGHGFHCSGQRGVAGVCGHACSCGGGCCG